MEQNTVFNKTNPSLSTVLQSEIKSLKSLPLNKHEVLSLERYSNRNKFKNIQTDLLVLLKLLSNNQTRTQIPQTSKKDPVWGSISEKDLKKGIMIVYFLTTQYKLHSCFSKNLTASAKNSSGECTCYVHLSSFLTTYSHLSSFFSNITTFTNITTFNNIYVSNSNKIFLYMLSSCALFAILNEIPLNRNSRSFNKFKITQTPCGKLKQNALKLMKELHICLCTTQTYEIHESSKGYYVDLTKLAELIKILLEAYLPEVQKHQKMLEKLLEKNKNNTALKQRFLELAKTLKERALLYFKRPIKELLDIEYAAALKKRKERGTKIPSTRKLLEIIEIQRDHLLPLLADENCRLYTLYAENKLDEELFLNSLYNDGCDNREVLRHRAYSPACSLLNKEKYFSEQETLQTAYDGLKEAGIYPKQEKEESKREFREDFLDRVWGKGTWEEIDRNASIYNLTYSLVTGEYRPVGAEDIYKIINGRDFCNGQERLFTKLQVMRMYFSNWAAARSSFLKCADKLLKSGSTPTVKKDDILAFYRIIKYSDSEDTVLENYKEYFKTRQQNLFNFLGGKDAVEEEAPTIFLYESLCYTYLTKLLRDAGYEVVHVYDAVYIKGHLSEVAKDRYLEQATKYVVDVKNKVRRGK